MKKHYTFVANWKMYLTFDEITEYATKNLDNFIKLSSYQDVTIIICPSLIAVYHLTQMFKDTLVQIGAQDCSNHQRGAFTGQVSASSLRQIGCSACIIGHSERRKYQKESNEDVSQKLDMLIDQKISPIICVGETLEEYQAGRTTDVLEFQLEKIFEIIESKKNLCEKMPICIAYEPVWAIGKDKCAPPDYIDTILTWLNIKTQKQAKTLLWRILYGGSITSENILSLKKIEVIDGFLIGGASIDFPEFEKIVKYIIE
jgi:triosephosphate isomerase